MKEGQSSAEGKCGAQYAMMTGMNMMQQWSADNQGFKKQVKSTPDHGILYVLVGSCIDTGAIPRRNSAFQRGVSSVHEIKYFCTGEESLLIQCGSEHERCDHGDEAGVICNRGSSA